MGQGKKKKMRTVIFDILILLCGAVLAVEIFLYAGTQHWMLLPLAAVVCCMALVLAGMVSSCRAENFSQTKKLLVKARKTWYDNSNEANNKAGHGRFALTHAPMQEREPPTQ